MTHKITPALQSREAVLINANLADAGEGVGVINLVPGEMGRCSPSTSGVDRMEDMVGVEPLRIEVDREEDGRFLASIPDLPGVMAYGATEDEAIRKTRAIALQVLAD